MRRATLVLLALLVGVLLRRRRREQGPAPRVVVGFADGSVETLAVASPQGRRLTAAAAGALVR